MNANRAVMVATVGLFAAATVAAVATVIAVSADRGTAVADGPTSAPPPPSPSASASAPLVDPCVVGLWEAVEETSYFEVDSVTTVKLTSQPGSVNRINYGADGTGSGTFSMFMSGQSGKYKVEETLEGESSFTFKTDNGTLSRVGQYRNSSYVYKINGKASSPAPMKSFPDAVKYACNGDTLVVSLVNSFERRYRRLARG